MIAIAPTGKVLGATVAGLDLSTASRSRIAKELRMEQNVAITVADTLAEYAAFLRKDYERWAAVIKASGVKAE